jgi:hypothetical protein
MSGDQHFVENMRGLFLHRGQLESFVTVMRFDIPMKYRKRTRGTTAVATFPFSLQASNNVGSRFLVERSNRESRSGNARRRAMSHGS